MAHVSELEFGIIDQGGQRVPVGGRDVVAEGLVDLAAHRAGGVAQDVAQPLVFAVDIADIVLGSFGQVQDRAEVDDLGHHRLGCGIAARKGFQVAQRFFVKCRFRHGPLLFRSDVLFFPIGQADFLLTVYRSFSCPARFVCKKRHDKARLLCYDDKKEHRSSLPAARGTWNRVQGPASRSL